MSRGLVKHQPLDMTVRVSQRASQILMARHLTYRVKPGLIFGKHNLLANMQPMDLVSMIFMEMSMNGSKIAGMRIIKVPPELGLRARMGIANFVS